MTTTSAVRRLLAALLSVLVAAPLVLGVQAHARSVTPPEPDGLVVRWFVQDRFVTLYWAQPSVPPDHYEVTTHVGGEERSHERHEADVTWTGAFLGHDPTGTPVEVSVREVRGGQPGPRTSFVAQIGASPAGKVSDVRSESRPAEDVLRLDWAAPSGADDGALGYHVSLTDENGDRATRDYLVDDPWLEVATDGVGATFRARVEAVSPGGYGPGVEEQVVYEDVPGPAIDLNARPRAGGFSLKWHHAKGNQAISWEVLVDGVVVPVPTRTGTSRTLLADVTGLETGTEYEIGVRGMNRHGGGPVLATIARTYDLPDQLAAPRVERGPRGGDLSVRVSWMPPADWGGGEECCYRITGHGPADRAGGPALVVRWSDAPATRFDFPVGRPGKWRFQVEAKTGAGFSPVSEPSRWVRAR
ncbi:hypothetical protein BKA08_001874 [Nocardioides marinisabuli]|uniref:Fibronectin type-III domain-containing protein n=1 Tax=Nocardioides marinisabuli TaxID=419476 RepID=A0A7Y9JQW2_9ACTN|nr:hypothetical protein [Nocardioides marinisabuli]NYD57636.1 hypothetical protein [Nocardioides marinisabuli]